MIQNREGLMLYGMYKMLLYSVYFAGYVVVICCCAWVLI